jgi:putative Holliday junction resolvase
MALDFGLSQIGVAVGNCLLGSTRPLPVIRAKDGLPEWPALEALVAEWQPDLVIVGDPMNMDGSDSEMSTRAAKFARRLEARLQLDVTMVDERLSSFEAKAASRERGHKGNYRKQPVDSLAAELILRTWLAENSPA